MHEPMTRGKVLWNVERFFEFSFLVCLGMGRVWPLLLVVVCLWLLGGVDGRRPELVGGSAWYSPNATLLNTKMDFALVQLDFDQPLYTNGLSFLCADADIACPPLTCRACDWSKEPNNCGDPDCCGPAQHGEMDVANSWCSDGPSYETLTLGETSGRFFLEKGERTYVRFFVPEEYYCRPIIIIPRTYYGFVSSIFSTLEPYPSFSSNTTWRSGSNQRSYGLGRTEITICPNTTLHPEYNVGTFAGMFYGIVQTEFEVELALSPEAHPIAFSPPPISCDDTPSDVMDFASLYSPAFCVEDGETRFFEFSEASTGQEQVSLVLPVSKGCKTISLFAGGIIPTRAISAHHLLCMQSSTARPREIRNTGLFRIINSGQTIVITSCFEEDVSYLFCSVRFRTESPFYFSYSTEAQVVRKNIMELPDASIAYMDGFQSGFAMNLGEEKFPCVDFFSSCYDWTLTPSDNTLGFFPLPASPDLDLSETFEDLQEFYRNAGLQEKKENRLSFLIAFEVGSISAIVRNLTTLTLIINGITNEDGEIASLPGGGWDGNPEEQQKYSISKWATQMLLADLPPLELPPCDTEKYAIYQKIVQERLEEVGTQKNLDQVLSLKYSLDAMNEALLAQSCTRQVASNLNTITEEAFLTDKTDCFHPFGTIAWAGERCCNPYLNFVTCCLPFDYNATATLYGDNSDTSSCGEPECAQSYYDELSFSLNHFEDEALGCTSGITNPNSEIVTIMVDNSRKYYTRCLILVGLGSFYEGIDCQVDSDCKNLTGVCHENKCVLPPLEEIEELFLDCYIASMPSFLEFYLKRNVLSPTVANSEKDSIQFYDALKEAATERDCVNPQNPLDIGERTRYQGLPLNYACVARELGLRWPEDEKEVREDCPGISCLRSFGCLLNASSCLYGDICQEFEQKYIVSTEENCPTEENCSIDLEGGDCDKFRCTYCPENGNLPCQEVPIFTNKEDCENAFACELPDGSVDFSLTEDECRQEGEGCTTDCVGNSCESIKELSGGCFIQSVTSNSECSLYSSTVNLTTEWYKDSLCVLTEITSETECNGLPSTEWGTCQQNNLDNCNGGTTTQQFLGCYISLWHECSDEESCKASGMCTDRDYYTQVRSQDPVDVQYGSCLGSGEYAAGTTPLCPAIFEISLLTCISRVIPTPAECVPPLLFFFVEWVEPSLTEEECLANRIGRRGCQLYDDPLNILFWILDEEECACRGGVLLDAWKWVPGVWRGGVPRPLVWEEAKKKSLYQYTDALSFILLAEWIKESSEEQFLYPIQSQIICESQSITNPVFTLVCDCLEQGGEICYEPGEQEKEIQMGLSEVCEGGITYAKDPSAQVSFGTKSVSSGCSFLNISIIYQNWFSAPFVPPPLSFKWQEPRERGVVINRNEATVGEVLGDGLVLTFSSPSIIETFDICLRSATRSFSYKVPDFGYTTKELEVIYPLGLEKVKIEDRDTEGLWYCSNFNYQTDASSFEDEGTIRLFPINRLENYQEEEDEYTDSTTRALCYTLGALYCIVGLLCLIGLFMLIKTAIETDKFGLTLPNTTPKNPISADIWGGPFFFFFRV